MRRFWGAALMLIFSVAQVLGAHTQVTLLFDQAAAKPGATVLAAMRMEMEPKWHTYWKNPGDSGKATKIEWDLPAGITAGEIQWQVPEKVDLEGIITYVFHNETGLIVPLTIGAEVKPGAYTLKAKVSWLECEKACVPGKQTVEAVLTVGSEAKESESAAKIRVWQSKVPKATSEVQMTARWDGPATGDDRNLIFTVNKPTGAWDFFNYALEDAILMAKTEMLPVVDGKVAFRKKVTKYEGWPKKFTGLALIPGDEKSAGIINVAIESDELPAAVPVAGNSRDVVGATPIGFFEKHPLIGVLWFAFVGGLILNIMPCVLPVISLKILGFVRQSNDDPKQIRALGLVYSLGVILSFMALAAFVIVIKQAGKAASWGMQFQNPQFLILITLLVTLVALNLFGVFEVTLHGGALTTAGNLASKEGKSGAFFNGVLATILATPCTAPFLGAALGFAFVASSGVILLTFLFVGLGLASPYLLLCWFPAWLKKLPKPGAWMEKFKIAMGFPMLATAIWLFSVALKHFPNGALSLGLFLTIVALAAWVFGEFVQRGSKRRGLAGGISTALLLFSVFFFLEGQLQWRHPQAATRNLTVQAGGIPWQTWSPAAVQQARANGQPVLVDFTADWCLTCQANKKTSLEIASVREKLKALNYASFLADNTLESPEIAAEVQKYQRAGVPLVLVFPADPKSAPIVLPELLTPTIVLDALEKAAAGKSLAAKNK